jgi:hypothetical protein
MLSMHNIYIHGTDLFAGFIRSTTVDAQTADNRDEDADGDENDDGQEETEVPIPNA